VLAAFPTNPRVAMKACKGPGKTAVLAWLGWNFLATRPHPKCAATSISGQNLADNFWTEMAKWQAKNAFLKAKFTWTKTRIVANDHPETWFMSARSWPQSADATKQADTLAGLHADYILFIIDESGGIPDAVMVSAEAALSSCVEGHIVQAGNPTMLSGPLYRACALERRLWYVIEITGDPDDAKRSPRISVEWAKAQIEKYGRDNPWVLVNVFGRFPPSSLNVLIGPDEVRAAMKRYYREFEIGKAPKILGVDVARFGDDSSVIMPRQGIQMFKPREVPQPRLDAGRRRVSRKIDEWGADATFIDATGGFGAGWIDQLRTLGKAPIGIEFAGKAHNVGALLQQARRDVFRLRRMDQARRRAAGERRAARGADPDHLHVQGRPLPARAQGSHEGKARLLARRDGRGVLTFAEPVTATRTAVRRDPYRAQMEYDPFAAQAQPGRALADYDPFTGR
jgi:phage terminase large subunit